MRTHSLYGISKRRVIASALCMSLLIAGGCSRYSLRQYLRPDVDVNTFRTIAVLPFYNYTSDTFAHEIIRNKINIELMSRGLDVIEQGEVVLALKELKITSADTLRAEDIQNLGNLLNTDAVITGAVEEFAMNSGISVSYPEVSVYLVLFDTLSGRVAWSLWHTTGGPSFWTRHFGAEGSTLYNASSQVIHEAFDALF